MDKGGGRVTCTQPVLSVGEARGGGEDCGTRAAVSPVQSHSELLLGENTGPVLLGCLVLQETLEILPFI